LVTDRDLVPVLLDEVGRGSTLMKQITKIKIGATDVIVRTPLDVFDTPAFEMIDAHSQICKAVVAIAEAHHDKAVTDLAKTIKEMRERGMFDF
jgi:hypothetical protein